MNALILPLKRSPRVHSRKHSISADVDTINPPSRSPSHVSRKTRPPPLQIIPELSENELDIDVSLIYSPATARPTQSFPPAAKLSTSRITLSAYTFSIDDALLMFGEEPPRSPALSASSSTSDGASSEDVITPRTSEDEDWYDFALPTPRLCPQRISIRPLCIAKTHSLICQEDEDLQTCVETAGEEAFLSLDKGQPEPTSESMPATVAAGQDFYAHEFENFISLSSTSPSPTYPARRDSLTLAAEVSPTAIDVSESKPRGRSRHSKPLPLLPPATPPLSTFLSISTLPPVQANAQRANVRRKRSIVSLPSYTPPSPPSDSRPLPRAVIPLDVEDHILPGDNSDVSAHGSLIGSEACDAKDNASIYSQSSVICTAFTSFHPIPRATPETSVVGEVRLPRSSTDSDAPRSSVDSISSFASSISSNNPISPFPYDEDPELEYAERLRSRWSSSTLASFTVEPPRTNTLLSPLKSVLGSRARRVLLPPQKVPPQVLPQHTASPKNKQASPLSTLGKHLRRQGSRSSTSSGGASSSDRDSYDGSPKGLKRKPIQISIFSRAT